MRFPAFLNVCLEYLCSIKWSEKISVYAALLLVLWIITPVTYLHHHEHSQHESEASSSLETTFSQDALFALHSLQEDCVLCDVELIHLYQDFHTEKVSKIADYGQFPSDLRSSIYLLERDDLYPSRAPPVS